MYATNRDRMIKALKRNTLLVLLFALSVSLFLCAYVGGTDVAQAADNNVTTKSQNDVVSNGLTANNTSMSKTINYLSKDSGLEYDFIPYCTSSLTWKAGSTSSSYVHGWYISFSERAYHAVMNGAIGNIVHKMQTIQNGLAQTPDKKELALCYDSGGTVFKDVNSGGDAKNSYTGTAWGNQGKINPDATISGSAVATNGKKGSSSNTNAKIVSFYVKLTLTRGGEIDSYCNASDGRSAWLDIYISDSTAPGNNGTSGTQIKVKDASSGIYSVTISGPGVDKTFYSSGSSAETSYFSNNTQDFTYTATQAGTYTITAVDNVGNTMSAFTHTVSPSTVTLKPNYPTSAGTATNDVVLTYNSTGNHTPEASTYAGFICEGYAINGWSNSATGTASSTVNVAAMGGQNYTYYAIWVKAFTLIYHTDTSDSVTPVVRSATKGTVMTVIDITDTSFTRAGHYFNGWKTGPNGTGTALGSTYTAGENGTSVNVYADWKPINYSVDYDPYANGSATSGSVASQTGLVFGTSGFTVSNNSYAKQDAFFKDWDMRSPKTASYNPGHTFGAQDAELAEILTGLQNGNIKTTTVVIKFYADWYGDDSGEYLEFGRNTNTSGKWGSESNPYVIRNQTQFDNMRKIVNGDIDPTGSIAGMGNSTARQYTNPQATARTYADSHFVLADNLDSGAPLTIYDNTFSITDHKFYDTSGGASSTWGDGNDKITNIFIAGTSNHYWDSGISIVNFSFSFDSAKYVDGFAFTNARNTSAGDNANLIPKEISVYASIDNSYPTTRVGYALDSYHTWNGDSVTFNFTLSNPGTYKYFRVVISSRAHNPSNETANDIQFAEFYMTGPAKAGNNHVPVGLSASAPFNGNFDGQGHLINYSVYKTTDYAGLFGYVNGGSIKNLTVEGEVYSTANYVGGIVGYLGKSAPVFNSTNKVKITGQDNVGGLVGHTTNGNLGISGQSDLLKNEGEVTGQDFVGGIVGNYNGSRGPSTKSKFENVATINGRNYVGGITGVMSGGSYFYGELLNSGRVQGTNYVGGIYGVLYGSAYLGAANNSQINITNNGIVIGTDYVGGIGGDHRDSTPYAAGRLVIATGAVFTHSGIVIGRNYVGGIFGKFHTSGDDVTAKFVVNATNVSDSSGESVSPYGLYGGGFFGWIEGGTKVSFVNGTVMGGEIDCLEQTIVTGHKTGNVVGGVAGVNNGVTLDFSALTNVLTSTTINANRFTLESVSIELSDSNTYTYSDTITSERGGVAIVGGIVGFNSGDIIGPSNGTLIRNSGNIFAVVGGTYLGGVAAIHISGTITGMIINDNSAFPSNVYSNSRYQGGIVGYMTGGSLCATDANGNPLASTNSFNGQIHGVDYVGGLVGYYSSPSSIVIDNLTISNTITATGQYVGGLFGQINTDGSVSFNAVSNTSPITGTNYVGGLVGYLNSTSTISITNSSNSAVITGGSIVGGIAGEIASASTLTSLTNSSAVSATGSYVGGIIGKAVDVTYSGNFTHTGTVNGGDYVGGIMGHVNVVSGSDSTLFSQNGNVSGTTYVGGLFGYLSGSIQLVSDTVTATLIKGTGDYVGGYVGYATGVSLVQSLANSAKVEGGNYVGGIAGYVNKSSTIYTYVTDVTNTGAISGSGYVGGILGTGQDVYFDGVILNSGSVSGSAGSVGGVSGYHYGGHTSDATSVTNKGTISGASNVGGIFGEFNWGDATGTLTNEGSVTATGNYAGGVVGHLHGAGNINGNFVNNGPVIGQNYVGGVFGAISSMNKDYYSFAANSTFTNNHYVHGIDYIGGVFGYLDTAGEVITAKFNVASTSCGASTVYKGDQIAGVGKFIGGFFGYISGGSTINFVGGSLMNGRIDAASSTVRTFTFNGAFATGNVVGGVVGYNESTSLNFADLTSPIHTNTINGGRGSQKTTLTIGGAEVSGAFIGGIAGYNGGKITGRSDGGALRTGTVLSAYKHDYHSLIAAYNTGTIENVVTGGPMSTTHFGSKSGSIAGFNSGTITNCYNTVAVYANANYGGGIVGYNTGTVKYCYNGGAVNVGTYANSTFTASGRYAGGIAGYNSGTISHCYNAGAVSGKSDDSAVGGVVGNAGGTVTGSWAFYTTSATQNTGSGNNLGHYVINQIGVTILPMAGDVVKTDWFGMATSDYNGFYIPSGFKTSDGKYLSLEDMNASKQVSGYADTYGSITTTHATTTKGIVTFGVIKYDGSHGSNMRWRTLNVGDGFADLVYDGTDKASDSNQTHAFPAELQVGDYTSKYNFVVVNKSEDTVNAGTFTYDAHMILGGQVFGCATGSAEIQKFDLNGNDPTSSNGQAIIMFDGIAYGGYGSYYDSNLGKTLYNVTDFKNNIGVIDYNKDAGENFYIYRYIKRGDVETMTLVYSVELVYGATNLAGTDHPTNSATALKGLLSATHSSVTETDGYLANRMAEVETRIMMSSGNVNYVASTDNGWLSLNYYTIDSDYGVTADGVGEWGSSTNPYVISHWIHLLRLSEIVADVTDPINSVRGYGTGNNANAVANNTNYAPYRGSDGSAKTSHFIITADIKVPSHVTFYPIGGWKGTRGADGVVTYTNDTSNFFGGSLEGDNSSVYRTIDVSGHLDLDGYSYVGVFGYAKGDVVNNTKQYVQLRRISVITGNVTGENYVAGVVGKAERYVVLGKLLVMGEVPTDGSPLESDKFTISGVDSVGSVAGYLGFGGQLNGEYVNYAKVVGSNYVGGIIGYIEAGAGRQGTGANSGTYYLSKFTASNGTEYGLSFENYGTIEATGDYVGGIIGAMVKASGTNSAAMTILEVSYMRNVASVSGRSYVGGFIGDVGDNNAVHVVNSLHTKGDNSTLDFSDLSYNGSMDKDGYAIYGSGNYVGGLFGSVSNMGHIVTGVFNTATVSASAEGLSDGQNVGGLVGIMNGGTFSYCFVSPAGGADVKADTDLVKGNSNVGGLVGQLALGTLSHCYVQGFKHDGNLSANKGGVAGVAATIATVENTWTLYLTADPTYQSIPANTYGKYILSFYSSSEGAMSATIEELLVFAGIIADGDVQSDALKSTGKSGEISASKGSVTLGVTLPTADTVTDYTTKVQVVFYDGSGYEKPFIGAFEQSANDSTGAVLYIRFNPSDSSIIIAKQVVRFGSITDYASDKAWEEKYLHMRGENGAQIYSIDVISPTTDSNNYTGTFTTYYDYDQTDETTVKVKTSRTVTFSYKMHSEVAPRVISSLADWKAFAKDVQASGSGGLDQYVKLAVDLVGDNKIPTKYIENGKVYSGLAGLEHTPFWNGDIQNVTGGYFSGVFDGDGHTIEIDITGSENGRTYAEDSATNHRYFTDANRDIASNKHTLTSTNAGNTNETLSNLFDGNTGTKYCQGVTTVTFTISLSEPTYVTGYSWNVANDTADNTGRNPKSFKIEGSTDGSSYTTLIDETNTGWTTANYARVDRTDSFSTKGSYQYFRVTIEAREGTLQLSEFKLTSNVTTTASSYNEISLFPQAKDATFQHLNLTGTITNAGYDVAAFVGHARGSLNFYNCISSVNITSNQYSVGAFIGSTKGNFASNTEKYEYNLIACVNQGTIKSYAKNTAYGTGGLIGNVWNGYYSDNSYSGTFASQPDINIESCRNAGTITGAYNVGGLIGRTGGQTEIFNSANTGNVDAVCEGNIDGDRTSSASVNKNGNAGGIIGLVAGSGYADVYTSYNTGTIHAWGNKAGGIMGSDTEHTSQSHQTKIYYCYNTGTVITGSSKRVEVYFTGSWTNNSSFYRIKISGMSGDSFGVNCGGILGTAVYSDIRYCYNVGDVIGRGAVAMGLDWDARIGGIVGMVEGTSTRITSCYNVGDIKNQSRADDGNGADMRPRFSGGIVGYWKGVDNPNEYSHENGTDPKSYITKSYSLMWQLHWENSSGQLVRMHADGKGRSSNITSKQTLEKETGIGVLVSSVAELTTIIDKEQEVVNSNSAIMNAFGGESSAQTVTATKDQLRSASYPGYVYVEGCLPQLAVFAVDTQFGLSMTSLGYGRDDMGLFVQQVAGSEFNPYVVKDGIDLLGVSALTAAKGNGYTFNFDGKYIEFANADNNLAGDVCTYIQMPTANTNSGNDYVFYDGSTKKTGKSYHLYDRGANGTHGGTLTNSNSTPSGNTSPATSFWAIGQDGNANLSYNGTSQQATWLSRNWGWQKDDIWMSGEGFAKLNFLPIGHLGDKTAGYDRSFRGHIDGAIAYEKDSNGNSVVTARAEIRGLRVYYGSGNADTYAGLFGMVRDGYVANIAVTGSVESGGFYSGSVAYAGIVAKVSGNSTIYGLQAGTSSKVFNIKTSRGKAGYVGGIVGFADSGESGNRLTIENCEVVNATISGHLDSIGGIVGYSAGADASSFTDITNCKVTGATLSSTSDGAHRLIGGIIGAQADSGALTVTGCSVGTNEATGTHVTIIGDNTIGGIISFADSSTIASNAFMDCYVYSDVLIKRADARPYYENGEYGTAIGGIVGYISNSTTGYATFRGHIEFHGTIEIGAKSTGNTNHDQNIGGVVGYMGTSARMEECLVQVYGTIDAENAYTENVGGFAGISMGACLAGGFAIAPTLITTNADRVGGFIGLNFGDTYITRTAIIYTAKITWTDGAGGGMRDGIPQTSEISVNTSNLGSITAHKGVGGFIGANVSGCGLHMGSAEYHGAVYGNDGDKAYIDLYSSVDGLQYVGGFLGYNQGEVYGLECVVTNHGAVGTSNVSKGDADVSGDCYGGVFGDNSTGGVIDISSDASFINNGQVGHSDYEGAHQEFVGGVIGVTLGDISNEGILQNTGDVFGYEYVGGAIGGLVNGTISGTLMNGAPIDSVSESASEALIASDEAVASDAREGDASVTARVNVGGVIGIVMQNATIRDAIMANYGTVTSTGDSYNVSNLGGAIGLFYGRMEGTKYEQDGFVISTTRLLNYGNVTAVNFAGGAIGVSDGTIVDCDFVNYAAITFTGDTALGGTIGYITNNYTSNGFDDGVYYPSINNPALGTYVSGKNPSTVTGTYFGYESVDGNKVYVQATGQHPYPVTYEMDADGNITSTKLNGVSIDANTSAFAAKGGLGGVIGAITSSDMVDESGWNGNTFFIYGDVYGGVFKGEIQASTTNFGGTVDGVGGVIGAIELSYVTISNMLVYYSNVGGRNNVGGIIGYNGSANKGVGEYVELIDTASEGETTYISLNDDYVVYDDSNATHTSHVADGGKLYRYVPASIDNCYNVYGLVGGTTYRGTITGATNQSGTVEPTFENVGGIVGLALDRNTSDSDNALPTTNASYWVKSYSNAHLQNSDPQDIVNTLDKASTWTEFLSYGDYVNNVDTTDEDGNNLYLTGDGVVKENDGDIDTWDEYFATHQGVYTQNANGDWGTYSDVQVKYTTGREDGTTGYYFLFAVPEDGKSKYAKEAINVNHANAQNPLNSPYAGSSNESLNYWLIIANSARQNIKAYASDNVSSLQNGGNVIPGHIYAVAYTSRKTGYYLYINDGTETVDVNTATTIYSGGTDSDGNTKVYISANAKESGNVLIFYKEAVMLNHLNYNGYERYAPIADLTYKQAQQDSADGAFYYRYTVLDQEGINKGKAAGTYHTKAEIYARATNGDIITLGVIDSTRAELSADDDLYDADAVNYKWTIRKRSLEVEFETGDIKADGEEDNHINRYDGTFSHYIKFTVTNFAVDENLSGALVYEELKKLLNVKYSFNGGSTTTIDASHEAGAFDVINVPDHTGLNGVDDDTMFISYYNTAQTASSSKAGDTEYSIVNGTYDEVTSIKTYQASYIVYVRKAGKHTVTVDATEQSSHASPKRNVKDFTVDRRDLKLNFTLSQGNVLLPTYIFDGGENWQGIQYVEITGLLPGDAIVENFNTDKTTASLKDGNGKVSGTHVTADTDLNTVTVKFYASNAGSYTANIVIADSIINNYRFVEGGTNHCGDLIGAATDCKEWQASWEITKKQITLENLTIEGKTVYYNGKAHSVKFGGSEGGAADLVETWGKETITIECTAEITSGNATVDKAVNVGIYNVSLAAGANGTGTCEVEGADSKATAGSENYVISYVLDKEASATLEIKAREIKLEWDVSTASFVYNGKDQGYNASNLKFYMKNDAGTAWVDVTKDVNITLEGNSTSAKVKVSGLFEGETLYFPASNLKKTNAGSYTATVNALNQIQGNNEAGSAAISNYGTTTSVRQAYTIAKSRIEVKYNGAVPTKVFDGTTSASVTNSFSYTSTNGGTNSGVSVSITDGTAHYYSGSTKVSNAGSGYTVKMNVVITSGSSNFEIVNTEVVTGNTAAITPAPLTITLNNSSAGTYNLYKTFDNSDLYAEVSSNGNETVKSSGTQFRTGRGITVDGFFTSGVTVTVKFAEILSDRSWANKYVNNVVRTGSGASTVYSMASEEENFFKMLVITLSNVEDNDNQMANYYIARVNNKAGTAILTQTSGTSIRVMDSRAAESNTQGQNVKIGINKYSLKATYSNASQSYANPDNSYNTDWLEVGATLKIPTGWGSIDLDINVSNGWMYANGVDGAKKQYDQYTRIAGREGNSRLGAELTSASGFDLCVTLRNQPTLVIGYFVSSEGEEIGSMAGLLIATEYFKNNFNAEGAMGYDFTQTKLELPAGSSYVPTDVTFTSWAELIEAVPEYDVKGYTIGDVTYNAHPVYQDTLIAIRDLEYKMNTTSDPKAREQLQIQIDALNSQLDSFELIYVAFEGEQEETLQYVYWKATEITEVRSFKSFVLVDNISAVLTEEDWDMLTGAFGTNWGVGKTYLTNVLFAEVGSVVIFSGSVFDYVVDEDGNKKAFDGVFDGSGYYIDKLTIAQNVTGSEAEYNIGMFAEVSGVGSKVTAVNLRNLNIQVIDNIQSANTLNVGGLVGKFAGSTVIEDVTVHGTINVMSKIAHVHVGGVIGMDETGYVDGGVSKVIDGAIVVATIKAESSIVAVGGIVGVMMNHNTTLTDVVSLSEVYAEGTTVYANGFVGRYSSLVNGTTEMVDGISYAPLSGEGKESAYMDHIFEISTSGVYTRISGGVSYDTLYAGSTSAFNGSGIFNPTADLAYGKYDMVSDMLLNQEVNTRSSMRLKDMVDVYVLGYETSDATVTVGDKATTTVKKDATSKYIGTADGTASNPIQLAYQQHLNLIRMFNYMSFELNKDVDMYTGYTLQKVEEAFTGTVTDNGYVINVRNAKIIAVGGYPVMFANQTSAYPWLKIDQQA